MSRLLSANDYSDYDPIPELLKHAYVLRTANGQLSQAKELEDCLTDLSNDDLDIKDSTVSSMLIFLNEIKSCYQNAEQSLVRLVLWLQIIIFLSFCVSSWER